MRKGIVIGEEKTFDMKSRIKGILLAAAVVLVGVCTFGIWQKVQKDTEEEKTPETVTIRLFSNLPDRSIGQGYVEQKIIDEYTRENPNIKIEVEALDEEAYKTKFKAYAIDGMPDVVTVWGQQAFLSEILEAGILQELDLENYQDYGFIEGSLEGFKRNGKLYGLPRNTDISCFYYNEKLFRENSWEVPETYDELLELAEKIRQKGMIPVAMDGMDGWPLAQYFSGLVYELNGDYLELIRKATENGDFSDPVFKKAVQILQKSSESGLFQEDYASQDYGTAKSLFTTGKAAMFYLGSWEASMALDENIEPDIRENIRAFTMPQIAGGKAGKYDYSISHGGGYAVSAQSPVKEEAIKFLNYMFRPDKLAKYGRENGIGLAAQDQTPYVTGRETKLQQQFLSILKEAKGRSGTVISAAGTYVYKSCIETNISNVAMGDMDIDTFLELIGKACR